MGILSAGINLACMRSSLELLEESKVPLLKGRSIHLPSHLYARSGYWKCSGHLKVNALLNFLPATSLIDY